MSSKRRPDRPFGRSAQKESTPKKRRLTNCRCSLCGRQFRSAAKRDHHVGNHDLMSYKCRDPCNYLFLKYQDLVIHARSKHNIALTKKDKMGLTIRKPPDITDNDLNIRLKELNLRERPSKNDSKREQPSVNVSEGQIPQPRGADELSATNKQRESNNNEAKEKWYACDIERDGDRFRHS